MAAPDIDAESVTHHLEQELLDDPSFLRAPVMSRLLSYLVTETLSGRGDRLRGYQVGVEALNKPEDFDPSIDAGVRVEISRLRRMLASYYAEHEGSAIVIEIPKGSYQPRFSQIGPVQPVPGAQLNPSAGPAIAILAFESNVETPDSELLAIGLRVEVLDQLCRYREFHFVDASGISGTDPDFATRCRDYLECEFLLKTQLIHHDNGTRLYFSVTDLQLNRTIWSDKLDMDTDQDLFESCQDIAERLAKHLARPTGVISIAAVKKRLQSPMNVNASDCILRWHLYRLRDRSSANHAALTQAVRQLLHRDPGFAYGYIIYAMLKIDELVYRLNPPPDTSECLPRAQFLIDQSLGADKENALAHYVKAQACYFGGDLDGFRQSLGDALRLNPRNTDLLHQAGSFLAFSGDWEAGQQLLDQADMRYHPGVGYRLSHMVVDYFKNDDPLPAVELLRTAYLPPDLSVAYLVACLVQVKAGNIEAAGAHLRQAYGIESALNRDLEALVTLWFADNELRERAISDLRSVEKTSGVVISLSNGI